MNLVSADGQEVNIQVLGYDSELTIALNRICMEYNLWIEALDYPSCFFQRLDGSDLIVGVHYGYQYGVFS